MFCKPTLNNILNIDSSAIFHTGYGVVWYQNTNDNVQLRKVQNLKSWHLKQTLLACAFSTKGCKKSWPTFTGYIDFLYEYYYYATIGLTMHHDFELNINPV